MRAERFALPFLASSSDLKVPFFYALSNDGFLNCRLILQPTSLIGQATLSLKALIWNKGKLSLLHFFFFCPLNSLILLYVLKLLGGIAPNHDHSKSRKLQVKPVFCFSPIFQESELPTVHTLLYHRVLSTNTLLLTLKKCLKIKPKFLGWRHLKVKNRSEIFVLLCFKLICKLKCSQNQISTCSLPRFCEDWTLSSILPGIEWEIPK